MILREFATDRDLVDGAIRAESSCMARLSASVAAKRQLFRVGLLTCVARRVAEKRGENTKAELLRKQEKALERSLLFFEDTLCNDSLTQAERRWLQTNRPDEVKYWRVLTDLSPEHLSYAS